MHYFVVYLVDYNVLHSHACVFYSLRTWYYACGSWYALSCIGYCLLLTRYIQPPVETQVLIVGIVPPGDPCRFPFSLFVFPLFFAVLRFPLPSRFVVFRLFLVSPSLFLFASLLSFVVDYVLLSRCSTPPPRCLRAFKYSYSPCVLSPFLRSFLLLNFIFLLFLPFFAFRFGRGLLQPVFFLL